MTGNRTPNTAPYIIYMPAIFIPNRSDAHNIPVSRTKAPQTHSKIRPYLTKLQAGIKDMSECKTSW